ncbi:MAG: hypothetical protein R3174_02745 [Gammaproteobacteria bacterium]|nr:hypothetical protein [Gammaproteobacteria bacterium]
MIPVMLILLLPGCASDSDRDPYDEDIANMSAEQRMALCSRFYRDAKVACQDGLQDPQASRSMECMSAKILLDRHCLIRK